MLKTRTFLPFLWNRRCRLSPPSRITFFLHTNHYLFPSIPNVHAVSAQTTGTVMQAYFPDGSHLPASPLLSLAHLWDDSQHISLAAICLSALTANQTSEQPNSLMGGGLETSPARLLTLLYLPLLLLTPPLHLFPISSPKLFLCFVSSSESSSLILFLFLYLCGPPRLCFPALPPPSSTPRLLIFVPAGRVQPYICLLLWGSERCACRPWWQREQPSLTWTYAVRAPIYNSVS